MNRRGGYDAGDKLISELAQPPTGPGPGARVRLTVGDLKRESERAERYRQLLLDMLRAPYEGNQAWAITAACQVLEHPRVRQHGTGGCACGRVP